jgi:hypothetical protein
MNSQRQDTVGKRDNFAFFIIIGQRDKCGQRLIIFRLIRMTAVAALIRVAKDAKGQSLTTGNADGRIHARRRESASPVTKTYPWECYYDFRENIRLSKSRMASATGLGRTACLPPQ